MSKTVVSGLYQTSHFFPVNKDIVIGFHLRFEDDFNFILLDIKLLYFICFFLSIVCLKLYDMMYFDENSMFLHLISYSSILAFNEFSLEFHDTEI